MWVLPFVHVLCQHFGWKLYCLAKLVHSMAVRPIAEYNLQLADSCEKYPAGFMKVL